MNDVVFIVGNIYLTQQSKGIYLHMTSGFLKSFLLDGLLSKRGHVCEI